MALYIIEVVRNHTGYITKDEFYWCANTLFEVLDKADKRIRDGGGLFNKLSFKCINVLLHNIVMANKYDNGDWKL